jgi:amidohydrolase
MTTAADEAAAWRRHLHRHPELGREEIETARFVSGVLEGCGIEHVAGVGGHGIVATIRRGEGPCIGLRADMDALPIEERTGLSYRSAQAGVMHACGHDGHTAALLGAARDLAADTSWSGTVHLVFQPAEERGMGGAKAMIADGLFDRFPMQALYAFHNWPGLEVGKLAITRGPLMAAGAGFSIVVTGRAGHAALPYEAIDPIVCAAQLVSSLQSIASRNIDPLQSVVLTIATINGGTARNQIPEQVQLTGTIRTHRPAVRQRVEERMREVCEGVGIAHGARIELTVREGGRPVTNAEQPFAHAVAAAVAAGLDFTTTHSPVMVGDDFGFFLEHVPGTYVLIGNGPSSGLHSPTYDFNDAILPIAGRWFASLAATSLQVAGRPDSLPSR